MIIDQNNNLFDSDVEALLNPVNTVGVMGKGLAREFKKRFPDIFLEYRQACQSKALTVGKVWVSEVQRENNLRYIIHFPTKEHFRQPSRLEYIELGLSSLIDEVKKRKIASLAIPALGCGLGGLSWEKVRPKIVEAFSAFPEKKVLLYAPYL